VIRRPALSGCWSPLLAVLLSACGMNEPIYFPAPGPLEAGAEGGGGMPALAIMTLSFRAPNAEEAATRAEQSQQAGFEIPWLSADDVAVSLLYTITNLSDRPGDAYLRIDGASEFASYDPQALQAAAVAIDPDDDELPPSLIAPKPPRLDPGQVQRGVVREDDFSEAALDLDAIGRFAAVPASVLINASSANPVGLEMVPAGHVRPALFRLQVSFSATTHMRLEYLVRIRDQGDRLASAGDGEFFAPEPPIYMPPPPAPPP
jgi:hypothetical protein